MAEQHALGGEQGLGLGAAQPRLEDGGHGLVVDGDQPLHPDQVERDQAGEAVAARGQAAGHAGAATEGHHRDVVLDGPGEDGGDVVVRARSDHGVGGVGQIAGAGAEQVGGRLPAGAQPPGLVVDEHVLGAEDAAQRVEQVVRQSRRRDRHGIEGRGLADPEGQLDQAAGRVRKGGRCGRVTPALGVHLDLLREFAHVLQCDT